MIGQTIWKFDENHRVYPKSAGHFSSASPIYREYWRPVEVTGESARSWLTTWAGRAPKKGPHPGYAFTSQEVDDDVWMHDHRRDIANAVRDCKDIAKLRGIADVLGWTPYEEEGK